MITEIRRLRDSLLGRAEASITVPMLDGALKPNRIIEDAEVVAQLEAPEDLATDGRTLFVADANRILRWDDGTFTEVIRSEGVIKAFAVLPDGGFALGLDGRTVRVVGGAHDGLQIDTVDGAPLKSINAITVRDGGTIVVTDGSLTQTVDHWTHDLMALGRTGRAVEIDLATGKARVMARNLGYAFGACPVGGELWISESWRHRVVRAGGGATGAVVLDGLPAYPSRLAPAGNGDIWLTCFTMRTQLVEFVLREPAYRKRMIREVAPPYWIAPALSSSNTYLEPMQGAQLKTMGVVKPWAPPRSYGLVIRLSPDGLPRYSLHSRFDGKHHGIVAAAECKGNLFLLAKGCRRVLRLPLDAIEKGLSA